ncbi:hypothetical protein [Lysobacter tyrosinilyticus]
MTRHHGHERLRLPRWVRLYTYAGGALCALSGGAWLLLHHFVRTEGEFGPEPSVLEHPSLVAHGVLGLGMIWLLGLLWFPHIRRGWSRREHRWVGGSMAALMLWLALSAAALYYLGDETWRGWVSVGHWALGLFAVLWLPLHIWIGRRRLRRGA